MPANKQTTKSDEEQFETNKQTNKQQRGGRAIRNKRAMKSNSKHRNIRTAL
jgi:hypothetical protein